MKLPHRRSFLHLAAGATVLPGISRVARAQNYPARPVRFLVGFPAGGAADTVVRIMAQWLSDSLGQPFIVENKPGAGTLLSIQAALTSPPDGYALAYLTTSAAISTALYEKNLPANFLRDGAAVGGLVTFPHAVTVHPALPAKTFAEFIDYAKSNPGRITVASYGTATTSHLAWELLRSMAGISAVHVPFRGDAQAVPELLSGRVQVYIATLTTTLPLIRSGALRALAVTGKSRFERLPDVPSVGEFVPGYEVEPITGIGTRKGTPEEIVAKLDDVIIAGLSNATVRARFDDVSAVPAPIKSAEFGARMIAEVEKWGEVIRFANIKPE